WQCGFKGFLSAVNFTDGGGLIPFYFKTDTGVYEICPHKLCEHAGYHSAVVVDAFAPSDYQIVAALLGDVGKLFCYRKTIGCRGVYSNGFIGTYGQCLAKGWFGFGTANVYDVYGRALFFLKPHGAGKAKFVVWVDYKLNTVGIKFCVAIGKIDFGSGVRYVTYTD